MLEAIQVIYDIVSSFQYEKTSTIYYTLRIYSSAEFKCGDIKSPYRRKRKVALGIRIALV